MMPMPMSMQQRQIPLVVHLRAPPCPTICVRRSRRVEERTAPRGTRSCASAWVLADTAVSTPRTPPTFTGMPVRTVHSEATFCSVQLVTTKLDQGSKTPRLGILVYKMPSLIGSTFYRRSYDEIVSVFAGAALISVLHVLRAQLLRLGARLNLKADLES